MANGFDEQAFQQWYGGWSNKLGLDPDPDNPQHFYDYRAAYSAGAEPGPDNHWPSEFKKEGHPNMVVDGINTKTGEPVEEQDLVPSGVIHLLANDFIDMPHAEGMEALKQQYSGIKWRDKEDAAKHFAEAVDTLNKYHDVTVDSGLNESFAETLHYIFDEYHSDEDKLDKIDYDTAKIRDELYKDPNDTEALMRAAQKERELDAMRLYLRRAIISKDTGRLKDMISRAVQSAVSPLAGTADAVFDTNYHKSLQEYTTEVTNPEYDDSVFSIGASFAGSIAGFTASAFVPYGPALYLGASLTSESKQVYDQVFEKTGDPHKAEQAMLEAMPANLLGIVGDRLVGGTAAKILKGAGGAKGVISGTVQGVIAEGGTETAQEYLVGKVLTDYTGDPEFTPTQMDLIKIFAVGGAIGGGIGAVGGYRSKQLARNQELMEKTLANESVEINGEKEDNPLGFFSWTRQIFGRSEMLQNRAGKEGKTVAQILETESDVVESNDVFTQLYQIMSNRAAFRDNADQEVDTDREYAFIYDSEIKGTRKEPRKFTDEDRAYWKKRGYDPEAVREATEYMTNAEEMRWDVDQRKQQKAAWEKNREEAREAIKAIFAKPTEETKENFLKAKERLKQARKLWEATEKKRPFGSAWKPNEEDIEYILTHHPEVLGVASDMGAMQLNSATMEGSADVEAGVYPTTEEGKKKAKLDPRKQTQDWSPNFGGAWITPETAASFVFGRYIINDMGLDAAVEMLDDNALGRFRPVVHPNRVSYIRELFKNPGAFLQTFWHELAHAIDAEAAIQDGKPVTAKDKSGEEYIHHSFMSRPAINRFVRIYQDFKDIGLGQYAEDFRKELADLDNDYVPYRHFNDPGYTYYRETQGGVEQFANAISALLIDPERVRDNYPLVWKTWGKAVERHPRLRQITNLVDRAKNDPTVLAEVFTELKREGQNEETRIQNEAAAKKLTKEQEERRALPKKSLKEFRRSIFSTFTHARDLVDTAVQTGAMTKEQAEKGMFMLQAASTAYISMERLVDRPLNRIRNELLSSVKDEPEVAIRNWANFVDIIHLLNDTNSTLDEVKEKPSEYKDAVSLLQRKFGKRHWYSEVEKLEGEDLIQKISALLVEKNDDAKQSMKEELERQMEIDAKRFFEAGQDPNTDERELMGILKSYFNKHYATKLLDKDAFEVRRLMPNYAANGNSLNALLDSMKRRVGYSPETGEMGDWEHYDRAIKGLHKIGYKMIDDMTAAGLLDAKMRDKLIRNVETYAPQNVLKYFEKDPRMPASIKKAYGSFDQTGNSITSYVGKMKALMMRAAYQQSQNNVVELARAVGQEIKIIPPEKSYGKKAGKSKVYYKSIFDTKSAMEAKNPDKSYFITAEEGQLTLNEINDPEWARMFGEENFSKLPGVQLVTGITDSLNKAMLAHWTKTLGSASFAFGSKFYDIKREAMVAGSKEINWTHLFFLPRHADKELQSTRDQLRKDIKHYRQTGEMAPWLERFFFYGGSPDALTREYGGATEKTTFEHNVYKDLGEDIKGLEDVHWPEWINKRGIELFRKIPFVKTIEEMAQIDELTTKAMGFWIAENKLGKGPHEAAYMARNWFGTPDPSNSGAEMHTINKLFLFSRANANATRALLEMRKDDPKNFYFQYMYRKLIPRMLVSGAFMGPIIGALFGEEEEEAYRKFCNKIPSYNKIGKNIIGLGFIDDKGNLRAWGDYKAKEIAPNWKAAALAIPMERGLVTVDQAVTPIFNFLEDLLETGTISGKRIAEDASTAFSQIVGSNMSPGLQAAWHLGGSELAGTPSIWRGNPQDYFRKKGILSKDVEEAGAMYQKFAEYIMWSAYNSYPAMFGIIKPTRKMVGEPTSFYDLMSKAPNVGAVLKRFALITNYGDVENLKEAQGMRDELNSTLKLSMGENTRTLMREASAYAGLMSGYGRAGKQWRKEVDHDTRRRIDMFNRWRTHFYIPALQDMRDAHLMGRYEKEKRISDRLERNSERFVNRLKKN